MKLSTSSHRKPSAANAAGLDLDALLALPAAERRSTLVARLGRQAAT